MSDGVTINQEIQLLAPTALVELFILDASKMTGGGILRFHAGTNQLQTPVVWQGHEYTPMPIEAEGFDKITKGALPRPKIRVANVGGFFTGIVMQMDDLIGAKITRKRTFKRYLDAVNFPDGINPNANPNQEFPDESWIVDQKVSENRDIIEWELSSPFDFNGVTLPNRRVLQNCCAWGYKSAECGWESNPGSYFNEHDASVTSLSQDVCGKRITSCKVRFGAGSILPFGGFPGANYYQT